MLQLRPTCENCAAALPPASTAARICSYECTFCADCVALIGNVCPNCGGGFFPRPIRIARDWRGNGTSLAHDPATTVATHKPVDLDAHRVWADEIAPIPPAER